MAYEMSQSPYERASDSNYYVTNNGIEIPASQSPYERVSDSNDLGAYHRHHVVRLNPLTNGSRIRTEQYDTHPRRHTVSIPLRTGLGFEPAIADYTGETGRLNPLTNGSRIRTRAGPPRCLNNAVSIPLRTGLGFEPWWPSKSPSTTTSQSPYERVSDSNVLTCPPPSTPAGSQSPYERVSDSNTPTCARVSSSRRLNPLTNGSRIRTSTWPCTARGEAVSIPLRTGLGFEHT